MKNIDRNLTMLCDFYELTMANGYEKCGLGDTYVYFDVFYRDNPDNDLGENWYKDLLSAYDVPALPNGCLDVRSRWYRLNLTVRQGARKNTLTSVGWVTHEYVTWEYRAVH